MLGDELKGSSNLWRKELPDVIFQHDKVSDNTSKIAKTKCGTLWHIHDTT